MVQGNPILERYSTLTNSFATTIGLLYWCALEQVDKASGAISSAKNHIYDMKFAGCK